MLLLGCICLCAIIAPAMAKEITMPTLDGNTLVIDPDENTASYIDSGDELTVTCDVCSSNDCVNECTINCP